MQLFKKVIGAVSMLLAVLFLVVGLKNVTGNGQSQSVLDSPEASGQMIGTLIPVVLFGVIGAWLAFSNKRIK